MNLHNRLALSILGASVLLSAADTAEAQDKYPSRIIRIVTAAPGSNHDWGARLTAQELSPRIGQKVIVENKGSIATEYVAKDVPSDGYTLLFYGAFVWLQPYLAKVSWDPLADLAPITLAITSPSVLVVHPSLPVRTVKEMIALARSRPGQLNYGGGGGGSTPHIAGELFKYMARVDIVRVRYKGTGPSMIGLLTGEVQLMFSALGPSIPHIKQGRMRAVAVTTARRTKLEPELPAIAETVPGFEAEAAIGFFAPKKTPPAIVGLLHREIAQALKGADAQVLANNAVEVVGNSPEDFAAFIKAEMARMGPVIKSGSFSN